MNNQKLPKKDKSKILIGVLIVLLLLTIALVIATAIYYAGRGDQEAKDTARATSVFPWVVFFPIWIVLMKRGKKLPDQQRRLVISLVGISIIILILTLAIFMFFK